MPDSAIVAVAVELFGTPPDQSDASDQSPEAETVQVDVGRGGSRQLSSLNDRSVGAFAT